MHNYASVGVYGATGYAGRELIGMLARHPRARIAFATSEGAAGSELRPRGGASAIRLVRAEDADASGCDVVFSCLPHGASARWVAHAASTGARAIDLSADLRVAGAGSPALASEAVYGLTEFARERVRGADVVANPGCYPTAALLALAPALRRGAVSGAVVINAASGVTGAGRNPKRELLFGEVAEDYRAYAVGNTHRHLAEMKAGAASLAGAEAELVFTPHLLPVKRGILETIYVPLAEAVGEAEARSWWTDDYAAERFVTVLDSGVPSLGDAVGTNQVVIGVAAVANAASPALLVVAAIDNLIKGAAGQAVQNFNVMSGWCEEEALPC